MKNGYGSPYVKAYNSLGEISERITDFSYKFSQKGDDTCQITVESDNPDLPDLPIYQEGVEYTVIWGEIGDPKNQKRLVVIRNVKANYNEEGVKLDLLLTDKASLTKTNSNKRVYNGKSVKDINDDIATRNGLISQYKWRYEDGALAVSTTLPTATYEPNPNIRVYETMPQANRSDYEVLKEAADNDPSGPYEIVGRDNTLSVQKPNFKQPPIRSYVWNGGDGELLQFVPESKEYFVGSGHIGIGTTTVNPKTKTFENSIITEGNNGVETKLNDQITSPNYDDEDDGPGLFTEIAGFISDVVDDVSNLLDGNPYVSNDPTKPAKRLTPIKNDPSVNSKDLKNVGTIKGGDKNVDPLKSLGFKNTKDDLWGGRVFKYRTYNTESPDFINEDGFNTAGVDNTATNSKVPLIPTFLTGQHSPSIEDDHRNASGKASSVQHKKSLDKNPATAKIVGNTSIESGLIVTIENVGKKFSGNYYINEATHRVTPGQYYFIDLEFVRNAIGRVSKQPKNLVDVSIKYSKLGNSLEVNKSKGPTDNAISKKKIEKTDATKPNTLLDKFKFRDLPKGFENSGL